MKKVYLLLYLVGSILIHSNAQPRLRAFPGDGSVTLRGNGGGITNPTHYDVYRGTTNPPTALYTTFQDGYNYEWVDNQADNGTFYFYRIKSRNSNNGNESVFSLVDAAMPSPDEGPHFYFDGIDDRVVSWGNQFLADVTSIEFWFRIDEPPSGKNIEIFSIQCTDNQHLRNQNFIRVFHGQSELTVELRKDDWETSNPRYRSVSTENVADGGWHFIKMTGLNSSVIGVTLDDTNYSIVLDANGNAEFNLNATHNIIIGGRSNSTTAYLNGAIDGVKILDGNGVRADWRFDEPNYVITAFDSGPNNHNITKEGVTTTDSPLLHTSYDPNGTALEWSFFGEPQQSNITQYRVLRTRIDIPSTVEQLATLPSTANSYLDTQPLEGAEYEYVVQGMVGTTLGSFASDVIAPIEDLGNSLLFENSGGYVEIDERITLNQKGTIEFRFKSSEQPPAGESYSLLSRHSSSGSNNGFNIIHGASNLFVQIKQAGTSVNISDDVNLLDGEWHHVALIYDWNGVNQLVVDGVLEATGSVSNLTIDNSPLRVGESRDSFWAPFKGEIDELRIWEKQLFVPDVLASKDARISGNAEDLGGVWHFDESIGSIAYDNGSLNLNGTLSGDVSFKRAEGLLRFSSSTDGFTETLGNNGGISGGMLIEILGNSFANPSSIINDNQFIIENLVVEPNINPTPSITDGLDPIMAVNPDGKSATLIFNGEAYYHEAINSTSDLVISFDPAIFQDQSNPISNIDMASTGISFDYLDNTAPSLILPIEDFSLFIDSGPAEMDLTNHIYDPDFAQNFQYVISKDNNIISISQQGAILDISPGGQGEGATEVTVYFTDSNGGEVSDTFVVHVIKRDQDIVFFPIPTIDIASNSTVTLGAFSTSGLAVQYNLLQGNGSIDQSGTLTMNETGIFRVSINQEGDETFAPADEVILTITVTDSRKSDQMITFNAIPDQVYGTTLQLSASSNSNLPVDYTVVAGPVTVDGDQLTITGVGEATIAANQNGNGDYNPATEVTQSFTIGKADQTITIETISDKVITDGSFEVVATTTSDLGLTYSVEGPATINGTTVSLTGQLGTVILTASQDGNENYNSATGSESFEVLEEITLSVFEDQRVTFYPNPFDEYLVIDGTNVEEVNIFNLEGRLVARPSLTGNRIDLRSLQPGMYLLETLHEGKRERTRIQKKN